MFAWLEQPVSLVRGNGRPPGRRCPLRDSNAGGRSRVSPQRRDSRGRRCADLRHGHLQPFRRHERQRRGRRDERRSLPHGTEADGQPRGRRDRLPGPRHLQREPPRQPRRAARGADPADQRSRRAGDARRAPLRSAGLERRGLLPTSPSTVATPSDLPSPTVDGDRVTFARDDVTDGHTSICFSIGSLGWGTAHDVVLDGNRIHDCGRLPTARRTTTTASTSSPRAAP